MNSDHKPKTSLLSLYVILLIQLSCQLIKWSLQPMVCVLWILMC